VKGHTVIVPQEDSKYPFHRTPKIREKHYYGVAIRNRAGGNFIDQVHCPSLALQSHVI
jgi:hypothetical protein